MSLKSTGLFGLATVYMNRVIFLQMIYARPQTNAMPPRPRLLAVAPDFRYEYAYISCRGKHLDDRQSHPVRKH
jgi:hypothetical protein